MASIQYVVNATDAASSVFAKIALSADGLDKQLEDLGKRVAEPEVDLKDAAFTAGVIRAAERIDKLSEKMATPGANLEDGKFQAEIIKINAQLDRLDKRHVTATVTVDTDRSFLSRIGGLFGGGGGGAAAGAAGAAGSGAPGLGGLASAVGPAGMAVGIAALIGGAMSLLPALLPTALGIGAGGGAAGGAFLLGSAANKQLVALQKSLASAKGPQKAAIQGQIKALQQTSGPELAIFGAFQNLGAAAKGTFAGALKAPGPGFSAGGGQAGAPSFLTSLTGILKQLGSFAKTLQPILADLFRASVPYLQLFVKFLEQAAKMLLPVFTAALKQMTPFLPMISAGLLNIIQGLAGMIKAMGPGGMKASAEIFVALCRAMEFILIGVGHAADWLAKAIMIAAHAIVVAWHWLIPAFEDFRHRTAVIFDGVRHDIAHIWDLIFENSIGMVIRLVHNMETWYNSGRHEIAVVFDGMRHDIASAWDTIWNNTVGRVQRGIGDVVNWFRGLPGKVTAAVLGLGTKLWNLGHTWLVDLWHGIESVVSDVENFFTGLPKRILGWLGIHSPPGWAIEAGKQIMHGLGIGMAQAHHRVADATRAVAQAARAGPGGGAPAANAALAHRMYASQLTPASWAAWNAVAMAESGWNQFARNPTSGAYGIAQALPPSKMPFAAQAAGGSNPMAQISWMWNYMRAAYGGPLGAEAHELSAGWYDRGGWLPPGLSLALNTTGAPERVGGGNITVNVNVSPLASPAETGRKVAEVLAEFKKRGGMVYAPGGF